MSAIRCSDSPLAANSSTVLRRAAAEVSAKVNRALARITRQFGEYFGKVSPQQSIDITQRGPDRVLVVCVVIPRIVEHLSGEFHTYAK